MVVPALSGIRFESGQDIVTYSKNQIRKKQVTSIWADVAQSVERAPFKRVAVGSSPTVGIFNLIKFKSVAIFPERSKGVISSVIGYAFAGSNPADSTN